MSSAAPLRFLLNARIWGWVLGMAAAFAVIYFSLPKPPAGRTGPAVDPAANGKPNGSQCESKLVKWILSVDPERLQFNTDIASRISELNRYWTTCGSTGGDPIVTDLQPIQAAVHGDYLERVLSPSFGRRDVEHIRQSLLLSRMATRIGGAQKSDLDRTIAAMVLVSQQVEPLAAESSTDHPLTPFESLLLGQGTPSDRAWILAEILRQLHLDSVVLTSDEAAISPLVGVVIESEVYLFEPLTGLPVPAAGESQRKSLFREPATLKAALADDSILRQLDIEGLPFPWTAAKLQAATVGLVGTSNTWAPRLAELQFQWPTTQMCVIYDGLGPSSDRQRGLVERVSEVLAPLGYSGKRIQVWEYPERQCALYVSLNAEAAPHMVPLVTVMSGPTLFGEVSDSKSGKISVVLQRSKRTLQQARMQQLLGHQLQAIEGYIPLLKVHMASPPVVNAEIQAALEQNLRVADRATYWMAATQFENNKLPACVSTLKSYAKNFPLGEMGEATAMRLSACLMKSQEYAAAAQILEGIGPGPNLLRRKLLARRLREMSQMQGATPAANPTGPQPSPSAPANDTIPPPPMAEAIPK